MSSLRAGLRGSVSTKTAPDSFLSGAVFVAYPRSTLTGGTEAERVRVAEMIQSASRAALGTKVPKFAQIAPPEPRLGVVNVVRVSGESVKRDVFAA